MAKNNQSKKESKDIRALANKLATQQKFEGQTKEHNKLIAQAIHKGIEQYLRQQSERARELDKKAKKLEKQQVQLLQPTEKGLPVSDVENSQSIVPWLLLLVSWVGFVAFCFRGEF